LRRVTSPSPRGPLLERTDLRHPEGLAIFEKVAVTESEGVVICVHGSLDRARSFARVARRLRSFDVVSYDRRGYQDSRDLGSSADLTRHVEDLLEVIELAADRGPTTVFGHSLGGVIAIAAALAAPSSIGAVIAYESPMRWLIDDGPDWWHPQADAGDEAEVFFRLITSDASWERLSDREKADRRADGPALVADLTMVRTPIPFSAADLSSIEVPVVVAVGSVSDHPRYARSADVIVGAAPIAARRTVDGAAHGAHLSHPDGVAALITEVARRYAEQQGAAS